MKIISMLISIILLGGCVTHYSPSFKYKNETISVSNSLGTMSWGNVFNPTSWGYGAASFLKLVPNNNANMVFDDMVRANVIFYNSYSKNFCKKPDLYKKYNWEYFRVDVIVTQENKDKFQFKFNNSKVYMIKEDKKIHLEVVDSTSGQFLPYGTYSFKNDISSSFYSPFRCEDLEGVELEIGGLYVNGVEAPPLKFTMNYTNAIKKKWKHKSK